MKVLYAVLYFIALGLLIIRDGSRDVAIAGLFIAGSIVQLADVLSMIAIGFSKEGIKIRRVRKKSDDLDKQDILDGVQTMTDLYTFNKEEESNESEQD